MKYSYNYIFTLFKDLKKKSMTELGGKPWRDRTNPEVTERTTQPKSSDKTCQKTDTALSKSSQKISDPEFLTITTVIIYKVAVKFSIFVASNIFSLYKP